jgi:putative ABC transport system permease protein
MLKNYFTVALRNLWRHKNTAFVNIFGLAVGMAACLLLAVNVQDEWSFDRFHAKESRLYRLCTFAQNNDGEERTGAQAIPLTPTLLREISDIEQATRVTSLGATSVRVGNTVFRTTPMFADPHFFTMFSFPFLHGSPDKALSGMKSVVLCKELADKFFGANVTATGKTIQIQLNGTFQDFLVSGIVANPPINSSLEPRMTIRFEHLPWYAEAKDQWNSWSHDVFVQTRKGVDVRALETNLRAFDKTHFAQDIAERRQSGVKPNANGSYLETKLQPIADLHFNTLLEPEAGGQTFVFALVGIGAFILLIACINFVNLSIARSVGRTKEVGVRKVLGAGRGTIAAQFLGESLLVVAIALLLGVVLAELALPLFNAALGKKLVFDVASNGLFIVGVLAVVVLVVVAAAAYPALYVSRFQAASALKGNVGNRTGRGSAALRVRGVLVVVQFTFAIALIAATLVVVRQTQFLYTKHLGFDRENIVMIPIGNDAAGRLALGRYKTLLQNRPDIVAVTGSAKPVGRGLDGSDYQSNSGTLFRGGTLRMALLQVDMDYPATLGIPLVTGRHFAKEFMSVDTTLSVIVNESMARQVWNLLPAQERRSRANGKEEFSAQALLGLQLFPPGTDTTKLSAIVGVVRDFHFEPLSKQIRPAVLFAIPLDNIRYIFVRIRPQNITTTMDALQTAWKQVSPDVPWQGSFLNENIERQYRRQTRQMTLTMTAAGVAIALSCVGLFALTALLLVSRTKEIGMRKVLGASVASIVGLLSKDFLKLVGIAIVIATPLAYWAAGKWLQDFAYRVELSWWMFVLAGVMAVVIAFATVATQAWRAARQNPVNALRSE